MSILRSDAFEQFIEAKTWPPGWRNHNLTILNSHIHRIS
jgi:hypothetical protein